MKKSSCTAVIITVLLTLPVFAYAEEVYQNRTIRLMNLSVRIKKNLGFTSQASDNIIPCFLIATLKEVSFVFSNKCDGYLFSPIPKRILISV